MSYKLILCLSGCVIVLILVFIAWQKYKPFSLAEKNPSLNIKGKTLSLEIADTPEELAKGLSGHKPLAENEAMLFIFSPPQNVVFWMKNMTFSIDIIFIADGKVMQVFSKVPPPLPNTPDSQLERYVSPGPVDYVLETQAGWSEKNKIEVGDQVFLNLEVLQGK